MKITSLPKYERSSYKDITTEEKLIIYPEIPKCKLCQKDMMTKCEYDKFLKFKPKSNRYLMFPLMHEGVMYFREICDNCLDEKFPNKKYNTLSEQTQFALQIGDEEFDKIKKSKLDNVSIESFIKRHGDVFGVQKFKEYSDKQKFSNSYEYFKNTRNWSMEEFNEYNASRAVTLENMIKKHGEIEGTIKFDAYREKQAYTVTLEYFIEKYGEIEGKAKYENMVFCMGHSLDSYELRYGDEGREKFESYMSNKSSNKGFHSNMASTFFESVEKGLDIEYDIYYAPKTKEFGKYNEILRKYTFFDFVIPELKLCIEFNGDCFHANPNKYSADDNPSPYDKLITSKEIWEYDKLKNNELMKLGYDVVIVWEADYKINKEQIIIDTINNIKERYNEYRNREQFRN